MTSYSFNQLYEIMKNNFLANQDKITDFNEGSVISSIFEAVGRVVERLYIETRIGYNNNLNAIPYSMFEFEKKEGSKASSTGYFSASSNVDTDITINIGTKVANGTLIFETTEKAVIKAGNKDSNSVTIIATEVGSKYNLEAGSITTISSLVSSNVVAFTNTIKSDGGTDEETDTEMLSRFKTMINGLQGTNSYGLKSAVLGVEGVRSVSIQEHFPPQNSYNYSIYVDDGSGSTTLSDTLKEAIQNIVDGTNVSTNPGYKAAGLNYRIGAASPVPVTIHVTCQTYRTDEATATYDITESVKEVINNLTIGESLLITSLIMALRQISYVKDITSLKINDLSGNLTCSLDQICRFESVDLTLEEYQNDN